MLTNINKFKKTGLIFEVKKLYYNLYDVMSTFKLFELILIGNPISEKCNKMITELTMSYRTNKQEQEAHLINFIFLYEELKTVIRLAETKQIIQRNKKMNIYNTIKKIDDIIQTWKDEILASLKENNDDA